MADPYLDDKGEEIIRKSGKIDGDGNHRIRTETEGNLRPSGLTTAGQMTEITVNDSSWTKMERSGTSNPTGSGPQTDRNAISIQNQSDSTQVKYNYSTPSGYEGVIINPGGERFMDITDSIDVYVKAETGTAVILLEEVS